MTGASVGTRQEMREIVALHASQPLLTPVETVCLDGVYDALVALDNRRAKGRFVIEY